MATLDEAKERICQAASVAVIRAFDGNLAADCFCGRSLGSRTARYWQEESLAWVERVLREAAEKQLAEGGSAS